ncbi:hypothetical protein [Tritonibacter sp. SIMBA_163]|uniref:hypothetical protein n=1 Tax=Tritonibacter sp. SIMBA_163 TaxID=3080868 RepID=UPI003980E0D6
MAGEIVGLVVGLSVAAAGIAGYQYHTSSISKLENDLNALQQQLDSRPIQYRGLREVSYLSLATDSAAFNCMHKDGGWRQASFKGVYRYHWSFEYVYGVDIPENYDWEKNLTINSAGSSATLRLPTLIQRNPIKIQFDRFEEENRAGLKRFQRMYDHVLQVARNWTEYTGQQRLWLKPTQANRDVWAAASSTAEARIRPLVNDILRQKGEAPISTLSVEFEGAPDPSKRVDSASFNGGKCVDLGDFEAP